MNTKRLLITLLLGFCFTAIAWSQGYMATKTILDSLHVNKLHGSAELSFQVEQTNSFKIELDAKAELIYAVKRHKIRLAGNISYNFWDHEDNGNDGYFLFVGDFFQFHLDENKRTKTPYYFSAFTSFQYDFARDLRARTTLGMTFTWQPLREHPHLCLEPSVGIGGSFQRWNALTEEEWAIYKDASPEVHDYLGLRSDGSYDQWDLRVFAMMNLIGEWNRIAFNTFVMLGQPCWPSFTVDANKEATLPTELQGQLNPHAYPHIVVNGAFSVRIWKRLAAVTRLDFLWDGGQAAAKARNLTYCFTQGLSYQW